MVRGAFFWWEFSGAEGDVLAEEEEGSWLSVRVRAEFSGWIEFFRFEWSSD